MQIFLPIGWGEHFYVVVYNKRSKVMDIIDNRPLEKGKTMATQYDILKTMACMFLNFLGDNGLSRKELLTYQGNLLTMPWQDANNITDCGIFCMLHMETYKGDPKWTCGVTRQNARKTVHRLRVEYLSRILQSETNKNQTLLRYKINKLYKTSNQH